MTGLMESHCIPFREIPHTTRLFSTFLEDFPRVSSYYAHPPTSAGIDAAAREVPADAAMRRSVVEILREQNCRFAPGNKLDSATAKNLDRLAAGAVAIVTGQQVGLFSGPVFSFYKALSTIRCAEQTTGRGIDAVPIFWLATEDHDLAEVNHSFWNTRNGLVRYELPAKTEDTGRHVGEVVLGDRIEPLVATAAGTLEGAYAAEVAVALRESYAQGETFGSAFGKLMARLFAGRGIIFIDPLDARFHRLAAPVYLRALDDADSLREALLARSKELEAAGFHDQVKVTHESTLLFYKVDGRREPLRSRNGKFFAGDTEFTRAQLDAALGSSPESFTPSALLRPVVQDTLLPTAAYFGGPAEVAYLAQSQVLYRKILGRMTAIVPRASFTIIEPPIARFLAQYGLEIRDLFAGPQHLRAKMEQKSLPAALSSRFDESERAIRSMLQGYEEPLGRLDSTLLEALHASERKMLHQIEQLKGKVARAENFRSGILDRHERILLDSLYPGGGLQERTLCALPLLASIGPGLLDDLAALASIPDSPDSHSCANQHHVLAI
ncbi:MAG TPA: bacillithiol biosynthesis cysteine-adding enzyme BshC [Candidatus Cybelea sp.]|nr:bacillithiol biosynthesis cysteine-adding enzyme BshC [Candidatus Cybelea sp.]